MSKTKRFFYNGILLTAVGLAVRTVNLFFNAFVTRTVGAQGIGLFTLIMTLYGFAVTFATSGISLTVTRLVAAAKEAEDEEKVGRVLRCSVLYAMLFSGAAFAALFFFAPVFGARVLGDGRAVRSIRVLSLSLMPTALCAVFTGYFVGVRHVARNAVVQTLTQVFKIVLTLSLIGHVSELGVEGACLFLCTVSTLTDGCACLCAALQFLADRARTRRVGGIRTKSVQTLLSLRGDMGGVAGMALPLAVSAYIRSALLTLEHMLIPRRLEAGARTRADALSAYGTLHGMSLPMVLYPMATLTSFSGLLVPEFSALAVSQEKTRMERIAARAYHATLVYSVGVGVLLFLFSDQIGTRVYHSETAGTYIAMLSVVVPVMYLDHVTDSILKGIGEHVYSMWVNITDSCLSVILVWFLIPALGIAGYALVIVVMELYNFLLSAHRLRRRIRLRIQPMRSVVMPGICAWVAASVCRSVFVMGQTAESTVWLLLKMIFSACLFLGCYFALEAGGRKLMPRVFAES